MMAVPEETALGEESARESLTWTLPSMDDLTFAIALAAVRHARPEPEQDGRLEVGALRDQLERVTKRTVRCKRQAAVHD